MTTTPDFPVLDSPRTEATAELFREVIEDLGLVEPRIDEIDGCCAMPIRVAHDAATGFYREIGPYDFDTHEIRRLREAIRRFDAGCSGPGLRRVQ